MKKIIAALLTSAFVCSFHFAYPEKDVSVSAIVAETEKTPVGTDVVQAGEPIMTTTTESIVYAEPGCYMVIASEPLKTEYQLGEELDLTGLKIDVMFSPGGEIPLSQLDRNWRKVIDAADPLEDDHFQVDISGFDSSKTGTYQIKISLTEDAARSWWYCRAIDIPVTVKDTESVVKGDVNADGKFDLADVVLFQKWLFGLPDVTLTDWKAADLCEDGNLNILDLCAMKRA